METTYCAVVRDHSVSMRSLVHGALQDYNLLLDGLQQARNEGQRIALNVVECGVGHLAEVRCAEQYLDVADARHMSQYVANGSRTPLWDAVGEAIRRTETMAFHNNPDASCLVMVITDGEENNSRFWTASSLSEAIDRLQRTDRWTFVFRVPRGGSRVLQNLGVPAGNIMEWEQTEHSLQQATQQNVQATKTYFKNRAAGVRASASFYQVDMAQINAADVKHQLADISRDVRSLFVSPSKNGAAIRDFVESHNMAYRTGSAYYQLTKLELVQAGKQILVRDSSTGSVYTGPAARQLIGLPSYGNIKVKPISGGRYQVFVQSTSTNRKLVAGTELLILN